MSNFDRHLQPSLKAILALTGKRWPGRSLDVAWRLRTLRDMSAGLLEVTARSAIKRELRST